jgi:hypothetical protein
MQKKIIYVLTQKLHSQNIGQIGMIFFLAKKYETLGMSDVIMWASLEFAIAGYIVSQIQKEKKEESNNDSNENPL